MAKRNLETRQVARESGGNLVDLGFVADAMAASEQRQRVAQQNAQQLSQIDARQREAMNQEQHQALEQLAMAQRQAEQRQNMHDEVLRRHVDMGAVDHDRLIAAQEAAGIPHTTVTRTHNTTNHYDQSSHSTINTSTTKQ